MSGFHNNALIGAGSSGYQIERSLRFNSPDSAYLNRTPASAGSSRKFTLSAWVKITSDGSGSKQITFLGAGTGNQSNTGNDNIQLRGNGTALQLGVLANGGSGGTYAQFTAYHRDPSSWQHVVITIDTTQATQANRCRAYFNGVEETSYVVNGFGLNFDFPYLNSTAAHVIGRSNEGAGPNHTDALLTEVNFIDGQALTPSSFGETNLVTGVWGPKRYAGTYGTNGFYLKFADNSNTTAATLGKDSSGNGNNWTPNNFSVTAGVGNDSMIDTPTPYADGGNGRGNYCTLNPLDKYSSTIGTSDGNLRLISTSGGSYQQIRSTIGMSNGKYYMEWIIVSQGTAGRTGAALIKSNSPLSGAAGSDTYSWVNHGDGYAYFNNNLTALSTGSISTGTDIVMYAFDADSGKLWMGKNGTWDNSGNPATGANPIYSGLTNGPYFFGGWAYNTSDIVTFNFGQRAFAYTPPTGFLALNTQNLPEPSIKNTLTAFDATTWTGTGASLAVNVTGKFQPDLVWIKGRSGATGHRLTDSVRGVTNALSSNSPSSNTIVDTQGVTAFNSGGFTVGSNATYNTSSATYIAWQWKRGASQGFDISSTFTGTGSAQTVTHSLGVAPSMIILFSTGGTNWINTRVYHTRLSAGNALQLSTNAAQFSEPATFASVNSSSFQTTQTSGQINVAYLWSEVAGFSKFGSYTGNGSSDGPFVYCGFRPAYLMVKRSDAVDGWFVVDAQRSPYNVCKEYLSLHLAIQEYSNLNVADFTANGFKIRESNAANNASGGTYIFAAFAESPFKYSLAR